MRDENFDAIILLAGKGKRTGLPYNKVFQDLTANPCSAIL